MYAIIAAGGRQYRVKENDVIEINRLVGDVGAAIRFDQVLAVGDDAGLRTGDPTLDGVKVEGEIVDHHRGPKLIVFKMKRRKGYRKTKGHRQELTQVRIAKIAGA
jgi:large subunit ribosomal protein L21